MPAKSSPRVKGSKQPSTRSKLDRGDRVTAAFDQLASEYDRLWTRSPVGCLQREAVWRHIGNLFQPGQTVLDLGCGTGEEALRLIDPGLGGRATDASRGKARTPRDRGVDAITLPIENCGLLDQQFDAVL